MDDSTYPLLLRHQFPAGRRSRYSASTHVRHEGPVEVVGEAQPLAWEALLEQRVIAAEPDGSGHVIMLAVPSHPFPEAVEAALQAQRLVTYACLDPLGRARYASTAAPPTFCLWPEAAVSPGDSWDVEIALPLPVEGQMANMAMTLTLEAGEGTLAAVRLSVPPSTWHVAVAEGQPSVGFTLEMSGRMLFDPQAGRLVRQETETRTAPEGADGTSTVTWNFQELLGGGPSATSDH